MKESIQINDHTVHAILEGTTPSKLSKVGPNKWNTSNIKTSLTYKHVV